ncbi:hypothetical protein EBBID32_40200 [Sphingobium indicum BiD32]|uniref:Uncharacterized protein n=1 Tax=Sphingobium indicum BiD32 TaxID=1301087 RepID=N1MRT8_9SPHN|nr:hypothetical protein EBBID32_40200 [Sphingobium indicum BiD32]
MACFYSAPMAWNLIAVDMNGELINVDGGQHLPGYVSVPHNLSEMEAQT